MSDPSGAEAHVGLVMLDVRAKARTLQTDPLLSCILRAARAPGDRKRECDPWPLIRLGPEPALMSLDDRTAERQPDTHTPVLRRVEGFEQSFKMLGLDTAPGILHAQAYSIVFFSLGSN